MSKTDAELAVECEREATAYREEARRLRAEADRMDARAVILEEGRRRLLGGSPGSPAATRRLIEAWHRLRPDNLDQPSR